MILQRPLRAAFVALLLTSFLGTARGADTPRILIVGGSWAASIATVGRSKEPGDTPGFGSLEAVLDENGLGDCGTLGEKTAWTGRRAEQWARPEYLSIIVDELEAHPTVDVVLLTVGGNDFLSLARDVAFRYLDGKSRGQLWSAVQAKVQAIVDTCLATRPGLHVLIHGYDFLDPEAMTRAYGFKFHGIPLVEFNGAMVELGRKKLQVAQRTNRCEYLQNWGVLQHHYNVPEGVPLPGDAPGYTPFPGGDMAAAMPADAHVGDGVHPNDAAHRVLLQRAVDQYLRDWLRGIERAGLYAPERIRMAALGAPMVYAY